VVFGGFRSGKEGARVRHKQKHGPAMFDAKRERGRGRGVGVKCDGTNPMQSPGLHHFARVGKKPRVNLKQRDLLELNFGKEHLPIFN
jgi:hypothetical protein